MYTLNHRIVSMAMAVTAVAVLVTSPLPVTAQALEEVIVTARKREESLQDVPISVQALSGARIAQQGITDFQALAPYTPGFSYTPAPGASDLYIMRGLGTSGSGIHFEPSVGQVFNGFFSTRSRLGRSAFMDMAQLEVLKGPQGPIIGKNTSLGAINITPNKPTEEFEASLSTQYNFDASEGFEIDAVVSGPLTDSVRGRIAVNYRDVDGWIETLDADDLIQSEDLTIRAILEVDITDNVSAEFFYQRTDLDREGKGRVVAGCQQFAPPAGAPFSPARATAIGFDCNGIDAKNTTLAIDRDSPTGAPFNSREPFTLKSNLFGVTLTGEYEDFSLTSVTAWTRYDASDQFSGDQIGTFSPLAGPNGTTANIGAAPGERINIENDEDYSQFYQELRINSTNGAFGGALDYSAGLMFFAGELDFTQSFDSVAGAIGPPFIPAGPFAGTPAPALSRNEFAFSETDSQAIFGQLDYHFNDQLTFTLGGRLTHEEREGSKAQIIGEAYTHDLTNAPVPCNTPGVPLGACTVDANGVVGGFITGETSETSLTYNTSVQFAFNDDHTLYFTNATGVKSAGFDLRGGASPTSPFVFEGEQTISFEVGGKHTFLDGTLRFNWTVYHTKVDDLQVSSNDPAITQQIVAAADAESDGVEIDLLWAATDRLTLSFVGAYTDADYTKFLGSCYLGQVQNDQAAALATGAAPTCINVAVSVGQLTGIQDLKGKSLPYTPEFALVAGVDYTMPIGGNMELTASGKYIYEDDKFTSIERDPFGFQDATHRFDATLELSGQFDNHPWSLALVGRNLTDELIMNFSNASTLSSSAIVATNIEETRSVSLRVTIGY